MAWDGRRYYYRSRKVNGKVEREYVGKGTVAELCAQLDQNEREERRLEQEAWRTARQKMEDLEAQVCEVHQTIELVARAALIALGYCQHHRGEWRRKRDVKRRITD